MTTAVPTTRRGRRTATKLGAAATTLGMIATVGITANASAANLHPNGSSVTIKVAVVSNGNMEELEALTPIFEKENPGINVEYDTLPENSERQLVETDVTTHANEFNVVMISNYETPIWSKNGWLANLSAYTATDPGYAVSDLLPPLRSALSVGGKLYSVPFYAESSMVYYRNDLFKAAGLTMPAHPTWSQVASFAQKLNNPAKGVAGICLRGVSGWGENLAALDTVINTYGGEWFNEKWVPQLTSAPDEAATNFYVNLVRKYGEPGASNDGFTECLNDFDAGKAAMWYDATVAAGLISTNAPKTFANTGYAYAPTGPAGIASGWLYTWSLSHTLRARLTRPQPGSTCRGRPVPRSSLSRQPSTAGPGLTRVPARRCTRTRTTSKRPVPSPGSRWTRSMPPTLTTPPRTPFPYVGVQFVDVP